MQRWILLLASSAACLLGLELAVRVGDLFAHPRRLLAAAADPAPAPGEAHSSAALLHPLQGWAVRPDAGLDAGYLEYLLRAHPGGVGLDLKSPRHRQNLFGFRSAIQDYRALDPGDFAIAILGGSVAEALAVLGGPALGAELRARRPELAGRIRIVNLAAGGYKQPQQLAVLAQMLLLGVPLDVVVNVDGYNEIVFGAANARDRIHPLFPSRFHTRKLLELSLRELPEAELEALAAIAAERRAARRLRAGLAGGAWWGVSELARAIAGTRLERHLRRARRLEAELQAAPSPGAAESLLFNLPDACFDRGPACFELIADLWQRASLSMRHLAEGSGARYLHVLHPNQYLPGSKPLSEAERAAAFVSDAEWSRWAAIGYPLLRQRGAALRARGVAFLDLTDLFRDRTETIYVDDCCHYNLVGNEILARQIARSIAEGGG
jgi:hypothetical protein